MSLMQLLAVGRSLRNIKDKQSPYKMTQQNLLPKFGPVKRAEPKAPDLEQRGSPRAAAAHHKGLVAATGQPASGAAGQPAIGEGRSVRSKAAVPGAPVSVAYPLGRWTLLKNPFSRKAAQQNVEAPVQGELMLETVRVVRNDLSDADLEIVPALKRFEARPAEEGPGTSYHESAGLAWGRITSRFFGAGRT